VLSPRGALVDGRQLAVNARGDALVTWLRGRGGTSGDEWALPAAAWVEASLRPAGAPGWSPHRVLSPADELALHPVPVLTPSGGGAVWWTRVRRGIVDVTSAEGVLSDGGWAFRALDAEPPLWPRRDADTAADGTLVLADVDRWDETSAVRLRVRSPQGTWRQSGPSTVLPAEHLRVMALPNGGALAASLESLGEWGSPSARTRIVMARWDPGSGAWSATEHSAYMRGAGAGLDLAEAPDGTVVTGVVVRYGQGFQLVVGSRRADGSWGPRTTLSQGGGLSAQVTAAPDGTVFAAWSGRDAPRVSIRTVAGAWSRPEAAPSGVCVEPEDVAAVAAGARGELLLITIAGYANDWHPGFLRARVRTADGTWTGPAWLSQMYAGSPAAAIDGTGRMHVVWSREGLRPTQVEATSATLADAGVDAVRQDPVAVISGVRVVTRRGAPTLRFRMSRPGRVAVWLRRVGADPDTENPRITVWGRRGSNRVALPVRGPERIPRGRWVASLQHTRDFIGGCPVVTAPFRVR